MLRKYNVINFKWIRVQSKWNVTLTQSQSNISICVYLVEMKYLRSLTLVARMNRISNGDFQQRWWSELTEKIYAAVLRWFGHMGRMVKRVMHAEVSETRLRTKPMHNSIDGVKMPPVVWGIRAKEAKALAGDMLEWRMMVNGWVWRSSA